MWEKEQLEKYKGLLYEKVMALIEDYIEQGLLVPEERLPSERQLASMLDINRSTIIHSLDNLTERAILVRKKGTGTFVNDKKWGIATKQVINWRQSVQNNQKTSLYRQKVEQVKSYAKKSKQPYYDFSNGDLPAMMAPPLSLPVMSQQELIAQESSLDANPSGLLSLKKQIINYMKFQFDMQVDPEHILITSGTQQSLFLISQELLKPGDAIGIEAPSYFYSLPLFQAAGLRIQPIDCDEQGITIDGLEKALTQYRLKWIFLNPIFQNPTGKVMSEQRKQEVLDFCYHKCIGIVEDDAYSALYFSNDIDCTPIKKMDDNQQVIYLGSLSKYIGRHIRIGWMIAPPNIVQQLAKIRHNIDSGLSILPQLLAQDYLANHYQTHQQQLRKILKEKISDIHHWLTTNYPNSLTYNLPQGGLHLYARIGDADLLNQWLTKHIFAAEAIEFGGGQGWLRLSFAHFSQDLIK